MRPRRRISPDLYLPILGILSVLLLLEFVSRSGLVNAKYLPPVSTVLGSLLGELTSSVLWVGVAQTLEGWALGLGIALAIGVPVGIACGLFDPIYHALRPIIEFLRPVPSVALIPLAIVMLGAGMESKVFLAAFASTWPILVHTIYGVRDLDPLQLDVARSYRVGTFWTIFGVLLPSGVPYVATGARIASAISLALVVSTEIIIGAPGLGQLINVARTSGNVPSMYALIVIAGCLGVLLNWIMSIIERRVLKWHVSHRAVAR